MMDGRVRSDRNRPSLGRRTLLLELVLPVSNNAGRRRVKTLILHRETVYAATWNRFSVLVDQR